MFDSLPYYGIITIANRYSEVCAMELTITAKLRILPTPEEHVLLLEYKALLYGSKAIALDPAYTSRLALSGGS